ncbi:hypothetical protein [Streptomyces spiralis]
MSDTRPHITVGHHDRYGVVAATSHDNHVAEHILRLVGFERLPGSRLYGLTDPRRDPIRRGAQAVQSLRAARYSVTSDVAYDLEDPAPSPQRRWAQAAIAVSPTRAGIPPARHPTVPVEYRPAPAAPQPVHTR